jgi:hypothetical protein
MPCDGFYSVPSNHKLGWVVYELEFLTTGVGSCRSWGRNLCRSSASPRTWTATWRLGTRVAGPVQVGTAEVGQPPLTEGRRGRLRLMGINHI